MGVAVRGQHLEHAVVDGQQRHVERAPAQVEHEDVLLAAFLVQAVRDGRGGGLVDDAHDVHAADGARVLGRLALRVVEVRRHGHDGVVDLLAEVALRDGLHLAQHHGADLLRRERLRVALHLHADVRLAVLVHELEREQRLVVLHRLVLVVAPDQALHVEHRLLGVDRGLVLRGIADEALVAVLAAPRDVRRRDAVALVVRDDLDTPVLVDADAGVGGAEVDADDGVRGGGVLVLVVLGGAGRGSNQWEKN